METEVSPYLSLPARTLRNACHEVGRDDDGRACPSCLVQDICGADGPHLRNLPPRTD
jgi:hypothetical protein